ncbi:MAG: PLP-dependent transferase, partial [Planctomycetota bacterium]
AMKVAEFLDAHPKVTWCNYIGLPGHPGHERAKKYLPKGFGSIFGFGVQGETAEEQTANGIKFINATKMLSHLANVGDSKTLVIHPASTTHQQLTPEEQVSTGVSPDFVRLSIGTEHADDIIADLSQALDQI